MKFNFQVILGLLVAAVVLSSSGCPEKSNDPIKVKIGTEYGDMVAVLHNETPLHRDNFVKLVNESYYDSLIFHRVIRNFMIQGGDPDSKGADPRKRLGGGGPGYTIPAEFVPALYHQKGALAAARRGAGNPNKESSGSQFYIVQGDVFPREKVLGMEAKRNYGKDSTQVYTYTEEQLVTYETIGGTPHLDGEYTVFGQVIEGLNIVDSIAAVQTGVGDRPVEDVIMSIEIVK